MLFSLAVFDRIFLQVGMLVRGEADICTSDLSVTLERSKVRVNERVSVAQHDFLQWIGYIEHVIA